MPWYPISSNYVPIKYNGKKIKTIMCLPLHPLHFLKCLFAFQNCNLVMSIQQMILFGNKPRMQFIINYFSLVFCIMFILLFLALMWLVKVSSIIHLGWFPPWWKFNNWVILLIKLRYENVCGLIIEQKTQMHSTLTKKTLKQEESFMARRLWKHNIISSLT